VAQIIILRELLVSFYGNELTLGIILANWVLLEAAGVFTLGKYIDRVKNKINAFVILQIIFSMALPLSVCFSRLFKSALGIPFAEAVGLPVIFLSSFLVILPIAFCHGALFSAGCSIYSKKTASIGKIYTWETIGTILGGIILTYFFIVYLNTFQTAFIIATINLITCLFLLSRGKIIIKYFILSLIIAVLYLSLSGGIDFLNKFSIDKQWNAGRVLEYRNSVYGNIAVVQKEGQRTFFYNGLPIITSPYPDITFVEEFGHLPLLFHQEPKDILIIGQGIGGLISIVSEHPVRKIDYAEKDPLIIDMFKRYSSGLSNLELNDRRLNIINLDGRSLLKTRTNRYDIILIGISRPTDLSSNRFFTQEFFSLIKGKLNKDGILAFALPGSIAYLSQELRDLNMCVLNGLKNSYSHIRVIPGDYNLFLASSSKEIMEVNPSLISQRIKQQNIKTNLLTPAYLDYRLDKKWLDWFTRSSAGATSKINKDFMPFAVFEMLAFWNKQFSPQFTGFYEFFQNFNLKTALAIIAAITLLIYFIFRRKPGFKRISVAYSIATTGFFGMLINLILIFSFQVFYGYLYHSIGLLISIFMAGIAAGSIITTYRIKSLKNKLRFFIALEMIMAIFSYFSALAIPKLAGPLLHLPLAFMMIGFIPGVFTGLTFPLASGLYLKKEEGAGSVSGALYCSDLIGGWIAGILGGVVFLPVLGLFKTCLVIVMFKLSSFLLLLLANKKITFGDNLK